MTNEDPPAAQDVLAEIRSLRAAPQAVDGTVETEALEYDGFTDLDSFFDDHLILPIRGQLYRIRPASAELGLLVSRLMMAGQQAVRGQQVSSGAAAQLNDSDERDLYERLLGHDPTLPGTGRPEVPAVLDDDGTELEPAQPAVPDEPNPDYRPQDDVWQQMLDDGLDWQRIQHVGATTMIWTAYGKPAAQEFWKSGARPKASATPPPRAPQDRKPKAASGKSGRPGSTGGTRTPAARKGEGKASAGT